MNGWEPRAIIVLVLAASISLAHILAVAGMAWHGKQLSEVGGDVLIAVLGAMIAIIAAYVGKPPDKDAEK